MARTEPERALAHKQLIITYNGACYNNDIFLCKLYVTCLANILVLTDEARWCRDWRLVRLHHRHFVFQRAPPVSRVSSFINPVIH